MSKSKLAQVNEFKAFTAGMQLGLTLNPGLDPDDFMGLQSESTLFKRAEAALEALSPQEDLSCHNK